ncbi:MAG: type I methionyl aminopeptidase [Oscillospiraceae bacterium]|jgi:methionyl aminopeptidase|nr:type I methionyl aminopeptidase [Oscillospiraceae bacterium]
MIPLKFGKELEFMREAGRISALALKAAGEAIKPGVTTKQIDEAARRCIESYGAKPSFLGEGGFPAAACISVNDEVIHCVPGERVIEYGDIVSVDVGAYIHGFHGDNARTFACGEISDEAQRLLEVTEKSLHDAIKVAKIGSRIGDIGFTVQNFVEKNGFSVVRKFVGHGIGRSVHEEPSVPNFGVPGSGGLLVKGMVIAIEPMVNVGKEKVRILDDGWSVVTADGSLSAHFEHTVAITEDGPLILTIPY